MNDDITALCNLPDILFSQVGVLAPLNNCSTYYLFNLLIFVTNCQTNYDILNQMSSYFKILTETPVSISKATISLFPHLLHRVLFSLL